MKAIHVLCLAVSVMLAACHASAPAQSRTDANPEAAVAPVVEPRSAQASASPPLVQAARAQIGVTRLYDPAYVELPYPGGDVPQDRGVCTDVVVRALRTQGLDLQRAMHEDMQAHFAEYPQQWGLTAPNANIDHRRVLNQMHWFQRQGWSRPSSTRATDYAGGDIVAWRLNSGPLHIGIVSDRTAADGTPLVIHNIGNGTREDDILFQHAIIGHYRPTNL
jgi:uncharacterized protein YijF (DUF1287 family)